MFVQGQCLNPAVTESGPETSRDTVSTVSKVSTVTVCVMVIYNAAV